MRSLYMLDEVDDLIIFIFRVGVSKGEFIMHGVPSIIDKETWVFVILQIVVRLFT